MINFDRTSVAAPVIKTNYRQDPTVYDALEELFLNKCYLCEMWREDATNFQIEHFEPHRGDAKLRYDWNNLFLACGETCNQYKGTQTDILNPCDAAYDVETAIQYALTPFDYLPQFAATDAEDTLATNTCKLLTQLHLGKDWKSKRKTASLRNAIRRRATELLQAIKSYYQADTQNNSIAKQKALRQIQDIVSRRSPFTMLMRSEASKDGFQHLFD